MEYLLYYIPSNLLLFSCGKSIHCSKYFFSLFRFLLFSSFFFFFFEITETLQIISKSIEFELFEMKFTTFKVEK